jgi:hypothetical protein
MAALAMAELVVAALAGAELVVEYRVIGGGWVGVAGSALAR